METFLSGELDFPVFIHQHNAAVPNFQFLQVAVQVPAQKPNQTLIPTILPWYKPMFKHQTSESSATKADLNPQLALSMLAARPLVGTYMLKCRHTLSCLTAYRSVRPKSQWQSDERMWSKLKSPDFCLCFVTTRCSPLQYIQDTISPWSQWEFGHQLSWDQQLTHNVL